MKKTTIKQLLFTFALLLGGASSAWADPTVIYHRALTDADGATVWSASDIGTGKWVTTSGTPTVSVIEDESVIGLKSYGIGIVSNSSQISLSKNTKVVIDAVWTFHGGNSAGNNEYIQFGSSIRINALPKETTGNVTFNSTDVRSITNACSNSGGKRWDDVWTIHIEINTGMNIVTALTISGTSDTKPASYTLSSPVKLTGSPTYNAITMGQNNRSDSYVLLKSIKITETPQLSYTVKWKDSEENVIGTVKSGFDIQDASLKIPYYRYLCKDNVLYKISTGNDEDVPTCDFTLSSDAQTEYMTGYSAQSGYCVYCEEAENIEGMTGASTYTMTRCSGKKAAYCSEDITLTTLPAGTYTAYIGLHGNGAAQTFTLKVGAQEFTKNDFSSSTRGEWSETFTITKTTDIKINGGNSSNAIDNIYIMRASNIAACDNLGYTFSSTYPLDFTGSSIKAYIAKYTSGDVVTLHQVNKVPANTGLFIKSSSSLSNVSIPTTTAATDNVTGNVLVAQSTTDAVAQTTDTKTNYVLGLVDKNDTSKGSSFFKVPTAGVEVAAGKAYLSINYSSGSGLSRMNIVFEDEATGISDATHLNENGKMTKANYYDLSGRRVAQPTKGLYIVNGKKVVIK